MILACFLFLTFFTGFCCVLGRFKEGREASTCLGAIAEVQPVNLPASASQRIPREVPVSVKPGKKCNCWDGIDLLAACVMAEAEGESELGKRLVIDTILNRAAHPDFPDTIQEVIPYPNAFTSYWDGRMDEAEPMQDIFRLISEELRNQTNEEVLYFTAGDWPEYGTPLIQEGGHYFSG